MKICTKRYPNNRPMWWVTTHYLPLLLNKKKAQLKLKAKKVEQKLSILKQEAVVNVLTVDSIHLHYFLNSRKSPLKVALLEIRDCVCFLLFVFGVLLTFLWGTVTPEIATRGKLLPTSIFWGIYRFNLQLIFFFDFRLLAVFLTISQQFIHIR